MDVLGLLFRLIGIMLRGMVPILRGLWWVTVRVLRGAWWIAPKWKGRGAFGSARWAGWRDVVKARVWGRRRGLIIGRGWGGFLRHPLDNNVFVCAAPQSGKTAGLVIPALLDQKGAIIVNDVKGENYATTHRYRRTRGPVYRLDALDPDTSDALNPLDMIRTLTMHESDDVEAIAKLLVFRESSEGHWDTGAEHVIATVLHHVVRTEPPETRTLATVADLICAGNATRIAGFERMAEESPVPAVAAAAAGYAASLRNDNGEVASFFNNAAKNMRFWQSGRIAAQLTAQSSFSLLDMHRRTMTAYVIVPEDMLPVYKPFVRLMMGVALIAATRGKEFPRPKHKPLLLIDECAALGHVEAIAQGLGYLREYCRTMLIFQNLGQVHTYYGEAGMTNILANSGAQVFFGVNDNGTAEAVAKGVGTTTILAQSHGASRANTDMFKRQDSSGQSESSAYVITADEVRRMPKERCIVFLEGLPAIKALKVRYWKIRAWQGRWDRWRARTTIPTGGVSSAARELAMIQASGYARRAPAPDAPERGFSPSSPTDHAKPHRAGQ